MTPEDEKKLFELEQQLDIPYKDRYYNKDDKRNYEAEQPVKNCNIPLGAAISCAELFSMQLHEIIEVYHKPYFRIMRVAGGWMYNFYDTKNDEYFGEWTYVPKDNDLM